MAFIIVLLLLLLFADVAGKAALCVVLEDGWCFRKALSVEVVVISLAFCSKLAKSLLVSGCGKLLKEKVGKVVGKEVTWG